MSELHSLPYTIVDVFVPSTTEISCVAFKTGNPLAVVQLPSEISLSQSQKQLIAREFNLSETTFLHEPASKDDQGSNVWQLDIFTTYRELPFAGHPTIGSAVLALGGTRHQNKQQPQVDSNSSPSSNPSVASVIKGSFNIKAGPVPLSFDPVTQLARAEIPHNFHIHGGTLDASDLAVLQPRLHNLPSAPSPIVSPVRGMTFGLVQLASLEDLSTVVVSAVAIDEGKLDEEWSSFAGQYYFVVQEQSQSQGQGQNQHQNQSESESSHGHEHGNQIVTTQVRTRMIANGWEDPATGSAACTLALYLSLRDANNFAGRQHVFEVTQGVEMGRPCEIRVELSINETNTGVSRLVLCGKAVDVMQGVVKVPPV